MEPSEKNNQEKEPFNPEKSTDMEVVNFYSLHIDNPCEVEVAPGEIKNIRNFYIREAKQLLANEDEQGQKKLANPFAREILEDKIKEYEK